VKAERGRRPVLSAAVAAVTQDHTVAVESSGTVRMSGCTACEQVALYGMDVRDQMK
jgi:hypothetical protein